MNIKTAYSGAICSAGARSPRLALLWRGVALKSYLAMNSFVGGSATSTSTRQFWPPHRRVV